MGKKKSTPEHFQGDERMKLIFEFLEYLENQGKRLDLCSTVVRLQLVQDYLKAVDDGMDGSV